MKINVLVMALVRKACILLFLCLCVISVFGQNSTYNHSSAKLTLYDSARLFLYYPIGRGCKLPRLEKLTLPENVNAIADKNYKELQRAPLLQIHGNISYSFDYRSRLDTPFATKNLQQHLEQTYLDATLKGKYPFRIMLSSRQSTSSFLKNYTDVNVEFNNNAFQKNIKDSLIAAVYRKQQIQSRVLSDFLHNINNYQQKRSSLNAWLNDPVRVQDVVKEKEGYYSQIQQLEREEASLKNGAPVSKAVHLPPLGNMNNNFNVPLDKDDVLNSINERKDSLYTLLKGKSALEKKMDSVKHVVDSLDKELTACKSEAARLRKQADSLGNDLVYKIKAARSAKELQQLEKQTGTNTMNGTDKQLLAITKFSIGRSSANYSDLTVNNVSLTGINIEYNPSFYAAFAAGTVDYMFRDFVVKPVNIPKQNVVLGRIGWGIKDKQIFILSAYTGTKNSYSGGLNDSTQYAPTTNNMHIAGYSLEAKYRMDENMDFSFEVAKSSSPYHNITERSNSITHAFAFSDHNNEAVSAKLNFRIPFFKSAFYLFYKKTGANFQSYSVFNTGVKQEGWGVKWKQYLFKDHLSLNMEVRKNNFDNPLIAMSYKSSTIFKSALATFRKRKWPVLTAGYMPSTQLVKSPEGKLSETIYYALTASAFYNYELVRLPMSSSLTGFRFYNQGTDSGFVFYNAKTIQYTHNISLAMVQLNTNVQYNQQPLVRYWAFQQSVDVRVKQWLTVGAGLKNNMVSHSHELYWGGIARMSVQLKKIGGVNMQYSKDYLPNGASGFVPNNWGRATWFKIF